MAISSCNTVPHSQYSQFWWANICQRSFYALKSFINYGVKNDMFYNRRSLDSYDSSKGKMPLNLIDTCIMFYFCLHKYVYMLLRKKSNRSPQNK